MKTTERDYELLGKILVACGQHDLSAIANYLDLKRSSVGDALTEDHPGASGKTVAPKILQIIFEHARLPKNVVRKIWQTMPNHAYHHLIFGKPQRQKKVQRLLKQAESKGRGVLASFN